jgi:hypothetical protein
MAVEKFAIGEPEHQTVGKAIQIRLRRQLRHTGSGCGAEKGKGGGRRTADEIKGGVNGRDEIGVEKGGLDGWIVPGNDKRISGPGGE